MHADMHHGMTDYPIIKEVRGKLEGRKIGNHFCYHLPGLADIPLYGTVYGTKVNHKGLSTLHISQCYRGESIFMDSEAFACVITYPK